MSEVRTESQDGRGEGQKEKERRGRKEKEGEAEEGDRGEDGEEGRGVGGRAQQLRGPHSAQHPGVHPSECPVLRGIAGEAPSEVGPWARHPRSAKIPNLEADCPGLPGTQRAQISVEFQPDCSYYTGCSSYTTLSGKHLDLPDPAEFLREREVVMMVHPPLPLERAVGPLSQGGKGGPGCP